MKIRDLILHLQQIEKYSPTATVRAFDPDTNEWWGITGIIYDDEGKHVDFFTDEQDL